MLEANQLSQTQPQRGAQLGLNCQVSAGVGARVKKTADTEAAAAPPPPPAVLAALPAPPALPRIINSRLYVSLWSC